MTRGSTLTCRPTSAYVGHLFNELPDQGGIVLHLLIRLLSIPEYTLLSGECKCLPEFSRCRARSVPAGRATKFDGEFVDAEQGMCITP